MTSVNTCGRRTLLLAGLVISLWAVPNTALAQCQGWNTSLYVDTYYSPTNWTFEIYGEGVDYDAGCCYHQYYLGITATTPSEQVYSEYWESEFGGIVGTLEAGATQYSVEFSVGCWCIMAIVGFEQVSSSLQVPEPECPSIPSAMYLGAAAGSYAYSIDADGMDGQEVLGLGDAFANWTSKKLWDGAQRIVL